MTLKVKKEKFEDGLKRLEAIVEKLEGGYLSLDDSIKIFEEGMGLVKNCETRLTEAQQKIEILIKGQKKKFRLEDTSDDV